MKRSMLVLALICVVLTGWSVAVRTAAPACDPNNGGLTLPAGFCALVVGQIDRTARHIVVRPNGDMFVSFNGRGRGGSGGIVGLRDTNGDGKSDMVGEPFGAGNTTGLKLRNGYLYYATPTEIGRYKLAAGELKPAGAPEVIVSGFPPQNQHEDKDIAFDDQGSIYVNVGLPSNACANPDRVPHSKGQDPCPLLEEHGGIWKFSETTLNQKFSAAARYATGLRQPVALDWHAGHLFAVMNSRDSLDQLYPENFTVDDNVNRPLEPMFRVDQGAAFGFPYCFWDGKTNDYTLAPEYGGDGKQIGRCTQFQKPVAGYPAHYAPVGLMFYTGMQFPEPYRNGAFISFHGSWNRAPQPMAGYNIVYQPFNGANPSGKYEVFADGFKGKEPLMSPAEASARPDGTGMGPDGSLYITDSVHGKIWRVFYKGTGK
jgi:glucose/arabinose dehydrogenase